MIQGSLSHCVVLLSREFEVGTDLRFKKNSRTIIVCTNFESLPRAFSFYQMAGRSQRDRYFPTCLIYTTTGTGSTYTVQQRVNEEVPMPFGAGVPSLRLIRENRDMIIKAWARMKAAGKTIPPLYW